MSQDLMRVSTMRSVCWPTSFKAVDLKQKNNLIEEEGKKNKVKQTGVKR